MLVKGVKPTRVRPRSGNAAAASALNASFAFSDPFGDPFGDEGSRGGAGGGGGGGGGGRGGVGRIPIRASVEESMAVRCPASHPTSWLLSEAIRGTSIY